MTQAANGSMLEQIVTALNPEHIIDTVTKKYRQAKVDYQIQHAQPSYEEFLQEITAFMQQCWKAIGNGTLPESEARGKAIQYLTAAFKEHGGYSGAVTLATSQARMDQVIDALSSQMEREARNNYVTGIMYSVDPTDNETKTKIIAEVFERYKAVVGEHVRFRDPVFFAEKYDEIVQHYLQIIEHIVSQYGATDNHIVTPDNPAAGAREQRQHNGLILPTDTQIAAVARGRNPMGDAARRH